MLKHEELDPTFSLEQQYGGTSRETTILINLFDVDREDRDDFKQAWLTDASFFAAQPGYISAQLHQGIGGSRLFLNYAVFENTAAFAATNRQPEFGPLRKVYSDSATAHPHLFRRLAIPGICVGETGARLDVHATDQATGLKHVELDPTFGLAQQYADTSSDTTILVNLFDVDPEDHHYFAAAWRADAEFFKAQPGYISASSTKGSGAADCSSTTPCSRTRMAAFAATNQQPEFGPLRKVYPDSATANPHLFRRLSIADICVGGG